MTYEKSYKYIEFRQHPFDDSVWVCLNRKSRHQLGGVVWYSPWRQYVFEPSSEVVFSHDCLADIGDFLRYVTKNAKPNAKK